MPGWEAEVAVDEALARRLLHGQFPELADAPIRPLSAGWDSTVFLVDDVWAFRFPRREVVLPGFALELDLLPRLAPLLPVEVPVAVHRGRPAEGFPWPFAGSRLIPGHEATTAANRTRLAPELARALRALHAPETAAAVGGLREDVNARADMRRRVPFARERLAEIAELWSAPAVDGILDAAAALPPPRPTAVCHGDLHFRHLIVDGGGLRGVIDWIDVCRADPATDLQLYWSFFDPPERAAFAAAYGPLADETLLRARVIALFLNAALLQYGIAEGHDDVAREARASLERTVRD
jgi:aminoglycoside phosphotransferase (APT) family kinase protein